MAGDDTARGNGRRETRRRWWSLPGIEAQPHARAVLGPVLAGTAAASHAYLLHGPPGTGKRAVARALAAACCARARATRSTVAERVARDAHPDLTWVTPSGAAEMLVADIEEPVVAAAARTPFESARRVFVIESVEHDERPVGQPHAEDARGAADVRAPAAAQRPPRRRAADDRLALPAGALRPASAGADRGRPGRASEERPCAGVRAAGARRRAAWRRGWRARRASGCGAAAEAFVRAALAADDGLAAVDGAARAAEAAGAAAGERAPGAAGAASSSCFRRRSANATNAKGWRRAVAASGGRARRRSTWRCGWRSCGCATCCACAKGRRELVYAVDRPGELEADADGPRRSSGCGRRSSWSARHAPEPVAERLRGARPRGARLPAAGRA